MSIIIGYLTLCVLMVFIFSLLIILCSVPGIIVEGFRRREDVAPLRERFTLWLKSDGVKLKASLIVVFIIFVGICYLLTVAGLI